MNKFNFAFIASFAFLTSHSAIAADVIDYASAAEGEINAQAHTSKGGLPQFDSTWFVSQFFWLVLTFAVLYFVFAKITLPSISSVIENRKNIIESDLEEAEKLTAEADMVHDAYHAGLAKSSLEAELLLKQRDDENKEKYNQQSDIFRNKSESAVTDTENRIIKAKQDAMNNMNHVIAEVAAKAIEKIIGNKVETSKILSIVETLENNHSQTTKNKVKAA